MFELLNLLGHTVARQELIILTESATDFLKFHSIKKFMPVLGFHKFTNFVKMAIAPQLDKYLEFVAFWGLILYGVQSFSSSPSPE